MKIDLRSYSLLCCLLISPLTLASSLTLADQEKQYQDNLNWVKQAQQGILSRAQGQLDVGDYCEGAGCVNDIYNPPQKGLSDSAINDSKTSAFFSDETAGAMQENFNKGRPDVKSDEAFRYALLGQQNAYNITHGISNAYVDCNTGTQCVIDTVPRQCNSPTRNNVPCIKTPVATVVTGTVSYSCPSGWTRQIG